MLASPDIHRLGEPAFYGKIGEMVLLCVLMLVVLLCWSDTVNAIFVKDTVFFSMAPLVILCAGIGASRQDVLRWTGPGLPAILFAVWAGLSTVWAGHRELAVRYAAETFLMVGIGLAAASFAVKIRFVPKVLLLLVFLVAVTSAYALLQYWEIDDDFSQAIGLTPLNWKQSEADGQSWRVSSLLGNPNFFAGFLVAALPPLLSLVVSGRRRVLRIVAGLVIALGCVAAIFARSRAGMIGLYFGFVVFISLVLSQDLKRSSKKRRRNFLPIFLLASVGIFLVVGIALAGSAFLRTRLLNRAAGLSMQSRKYAYLGTAKMIRQKFLVGYGGENFAPLFPYYRPVELTKIEPPSSRIYDRTHSEYLQIASELGMVGSFLYFWLLATPYFAVHRYVRKTPADGSQRNRLPTAILFGLLAGYSGILIQNLVCVNLRRTSSQVIFWFFWGIIIGLAATGKAGEGRKSGVHRLYRIGAMAAGLIVILAGATLSTPALMAQLYAFKASNQRNPEDSSALYDRALALDSFQPRILYFASNADFSFGRVLESEANRQLQTLNPSRNPFDRNQREEDYEFVKRWRDRIRKALSEYARAENLHGPLGDFVLNQGVCHMTLGETEEAIRDLTRASSLDPLYAKPYDYLGRCYMLKANIALAEKREDDYQRERDEAKRFFDLAREHYSGTVTRDAGNGRIRLAYAYFLKTYANFFAAAAEKPGILRVALNEAEEAWRIDPERADIQELIQDLREQLSEFPGDATKTE
jgi:O-antigen ligase/tetratricopeptide (TPR) repeat protein